ATLQVNMCASPHTEIRPRCRLRCVNASSEPLLPGPRTHTNRASATRDFERLPWRVWIRLENVAKLHDAAGEPFACAERTRLSAGTKLCAQQAKKPDTEPNVPNAACVVAQPGLRSPL